MLKNRQQRLEGLKPSKRYTTLIINFLVDNSFCRFFPFNYLYYLDIGTLDLFHHHLQ
jgi:hypothetical protein